LISQLFHRQRGSSTAIYNLDEKRVETLLADTFPELVVPPVNAYFSWGNDGKIKTNSETLGKEINYAKALSDLRSNLDYLNNSPIILESRSQYPKINSLDLEKLAPQAESFVNNTTLTLKFEPQPTDTNTSTVWTIEPEKLITWLSADKQTAAETLALDPDKIKTYLNEVVAPEINQEPTPPRFMIQNGKVTSWQTGNGGRQVDASTTADNIIKNFLSGQKETAIVAKTLLNEKIPGNDFNIKEIIGTGQSHFAGSPVNRRHNIRVGADALNGLLIKPGEEFSLVKALGNVDASTGYLPELVIKGDKTTPEYGGGLCQIGTTIFRSALASGLPITARQSHSYRVVYYEPAGMDAAVYIPQPDVRFINDTGNYILIQARIIKDDIYFDFWGVKDGRTATTTTPVVYNIVKPSPMKTIISTSLKPGEKKCTESSHNGADAYFDYTVVYPGGATTTPLQTRRFKSHYVPWQAVCLIGATSTTSTILNISTSSSATINSSSSQQKAAE
jgi:vancomycin resistance protein YoaR